MILTLIVCLLAALAATTRGGSITRLAEVQVRYPNLIFIALFGEVVIWFVALPDPFPALALGAAHLIIGTFFFLNRRLAGSVLAAAGMTLNVIAITANGAMPVSRAAAEIAGKTQAARGPKHEWLTPSSELPWLTDVFAIPNAQLVFSVGDVVLWAGIALFVYVTCTGPRATQIVPTPRLASPESWVGLHRPPA